MPGQKRSQPTDLGCPPRPSNGMYPQWQPLSGQGSALAEFKPTSTTAARPVTKLASQVQEPPQGQSMLEDLNLLSATMGPAQPPQPGAPGEIFGADFQWDFNPTSDQAANIWSQMPAQSWLDTAEGWEAMLRPDSPDPTEGDLSVDSHAVHMVPKTLSVLSNNNLTEYVEEGGRKYHKYHEGKYLLPNDEKEQDRLDLQHAVLTMLFHGKLALAPMAEASSRVLDLATGTGIWAIEFAQKYPNATVIGTDLSPIQPDTKPENCRFLVEDSEDPWCFDQPFDYIHARLTFSCFDNPRTVIQQSYDNLKPGGWLEFQDSDAFLHSDDGTLDGTAIDRLFRLFTEGAKCLGRNIEVAKCYRQWMIEAGFEEVTEKKFKVPGNTWPRDPYAKRIGLYESHNIRDAVDGLSKAALTRGLGYTEAQRVELAAQAKIDVSNPAIHWYGKVFVVYGRKPYAEPLATDIPSTLAGIGTTFA